MVVLDNIGGDALVVFPVAAVDEGGLVVGVEERLNLKRYSLVLQRFDGLWVDDGGTIESQLDGFGVGNVGDLHRVDKTFRVGVEQTVHVFPNGDFLCIQAVGEDGRSEVGAFAP